MAYRDPVSGDIAWVAPGSFATPVAFALDATTGATLDVDIVPDAVLPHGSNEYLSRELQRQLDRQQLKQQQQQQGNDSSDYHEDDESIVGALPGTGQLYAMPLGGSRRDQAYHAATTKAGASATHHHQQLIAVPGRHHETMTTPTTGGSHHSHGSFKHNHHTGPGGDLYYHPQAATIKNHARHHTGSSFLSETSGASPFQLAADGGMVPFFHPDYGYQYIPPEHFYTIHHDHSSYYQKKKYKKILKLLGSWLPPLCALLIVSSFEMGRRKRAKDNDVDAGGAANDKELSRGRHGHDDETNNSKSNSGIIEVCDDIILGHGGHGTVVYQGTLDGRQVAVKRMLKTYHASADREISLLIESDGHPNVVRYFLKEVRGDFVYLALELCDLSLHDLIGTLQRGPSGAAGSALTMRMVAASKSLLFQITQGVLHLHLQRIVHRDLKPANSTLFL